MTRTQDEILKRIECRKDDDVFEFEIGEYIPFLEYEHAKKFLKPNITEQEWNDARNVGQSARQRMVDYMPFAWEKANDCRGISANRSLMHYQAWLWLDGDEELWPTLFDNYRHYGKDALIRVCEYLGLDYSQWDDGKRINTEE